jgi:uncharacterized membrane protein YhaH (DUF805 family)
MKIFVTMVASRYYGAACRAREGRMQNSEVSRAFRYFRVAVSQHYADFSGRVTRRDFWTYVACYVAVAIAATILQGLIGMALGSLVQLVLLLPTAGITARRLQDTNKPGQLVWLFFLPLAVSNLIGLLVATSFGALGVLLLLLPLMWLLALIALGTAIYLIYLCLQAGTPGPNPYGPEPVSAT